MKLQEFRQELTSVTPEPTAAFHQRMENTLNGLVSQEERMKQETAIQFRRIGRVSARTVLAAALITLLACAAALAAAQWHLFDSIPFLTGRTLPRNADQVMQADLYEGTVNNVEIRVREAGYDGRTLLVQYSYRMLDVDRPLGLTNRELFGAHMPEGLDPEAMGEGIDPEWEELLGAHHVGWNFDQLWFDGKGMDMPNNSGSVVQGTEVPGEVLVTEYWRLDNEGVTLKGTTQVTLPIGASVSPMVRRSLMDRETGMYTLPDVGVITFTYDADDITDEIKIYPEEKTELPEMTIRVREAAFSPLMTYITLGIEVRPAVLEAYKAVHGEGYRDEQGQLLYAYSDADVIEDWLSCAELVDGEGQLIFPGYAGQNGYGNTWAEFLYPYLEEIPETLYLAPVRDGTAEMTEAIAVIKDRT